MRNFKNRSKLICIAMFAVALTNCKGKDDNPETVSTHDSTIEVPTEDINIIDETTLEISENELVESDVSGSEDYDKMLDDYDEYVTEYVKFYKKVQTGDQTAMSEYGSMMEKATKLQESMQQAQGNNQLSATQITRMSKIQTKMLQAMQ